MPNPVLSLSLFFKKKYGRSCPVFSLFYIALSSISNTHIHPTKFLIYIYIYMLIKLCSACMIYTFDSNLTKLYFTVVEDEDVYISYPSLSPARRSPNSPPPPKGRQCPSYYRCPP
jgi:hypothetical protein